MTKFLKTLAPGGLAAELEKAREVYSAAEGLRCEIKATLGQFTQELAEFEAEFAKALARPKIDRWRTAFALVTKFQDKTYAWRERLRADDAVRFPARTTVGEFAQLDINRSEIVEAYRALGVRLDGELRRAAACVQTARAAYWQAVAEILLGRVTHEQNVLVAAIMEARQRGGGDDDIELGHVVETWEARELLDKEFSLALTREVLQ